MCGYSSDIREPTVAQCSTLAQNARDAGSIHALGTIFPNLIIPTTGVSNCPRWWGEGHPENI